MQVIGDESYNFPIEVAKRSEGGSKCRIRSGGPIHKYWSILFLAYFKEIYGVRYETNIIIIIHNFFFFGYAILEVYAFQPIKPFPKCF